MVSRSAARQFHPPHPSPSVMFDRFKKDENQTNDRMYDRLVTITLFGCYIEVVAG